MNFEKYKYGVSYPLQQDFIEEAIVTTRTKSDKVTHRTEKVLNKEAYIEAIQEYRRIEKEKQDEFKADLLEELEIADHPKADRLFRMACQRANSMMGIYNEAEDLATLLTW